MQFYYIFCNFRIAHAGAFLLTLIWISMICAVLSECTFVNAVTEGRAGLYYVWVNVVVLGSKNDAAIDEEIA